MTQCRRTGRPASEFSQSLDSTMRRLLIFLALTCTISVYAITPTEYLLAKAWPYEPKGKVADVGRGVGIVFSPDLSVPGNCRFYQSLGFACFEDADWDAVLS